MTTKMLYRVEEAGQELGVGRTRMFALIDSGEIESIKIGKSRRVPHDALLSYVRRLRESQGVGPEAA